MDRRVETFRPVVALILGNRIGAAEAFQVVECWRDLAWEFASLKNEMLAHADDDRDVVDVDRAMFDTSSAGRAIPDLVKRDNSLRRQHGFCGCFRGRPDQVT